MKEQQVSQFLKSFTVSPDSRKKALNRRKSSEALTNGELIQSSDVTEI